MTIESYGIEIDENVQSILKIKILYFFLSSSPDLNQ